MTTPEKVNIDVTLLLRGKQRLYGVRNNEYERYAQYCSRRVVRLIHLMKKRSDFVGIEEKPEEPQEGKPQTKKTGPKFDLRPEVNQNAEHMEIVLLKADSAFARYYFLKNTATKHKRKAHALSRLRKCQKLWEIATECAKAFCTEKTQLEVHAFQSYARATLELELQQWDKALTTFTTVTDIFSNIKNASNDPTLRTFCGEIIEDITPLIEFCRFNLGQIDGQHIDTETREKIKNIYVKDGDNIPSSALSELEWRGKTVPIVHDGLRDKIGTVVNIINDIQQTQHDPQASMKLFDKLIMESHSARQTIRNIASKGESEELKILNDYLDWNSYIITLERSRILLSTLETPQQRADLASRTYLRISENKQQYNNDSAIEALSNIWRALKVYYISLVPTVEKSKSLGLIDRAKNYLDTALNIISSEDVTNPPSLKPWAEELYEQIRKRKILIIANSVGIEDCFTPNSSSFLDDVNSFTSCSALVQVPPKPRQITPKGMIFNLARDDYLDYPNINDKLKKKSWSSRLKFW